MMSTMSCLTITSIEFEELGARLETRLAVRPRRPDRVETRPHVGVLRVSDDEVRAPIGAAADARELVVEPEHAFASAPEGRRRRL